MELLAEEVKKKLSADSFLNDPVLTNIFYFQSARLRERAEKKRIDGDEDEDDDEDDIEEELGFISPLDTVNPYTSFKQALTSCVDFHSITLPQADVRLFFSL